MYWFFQKVRTALVHGWRSKLKYVLAIVQISSDSSGDWMMVPGNTMTRGVKSNIEFIPTNILGSTPNVEYLESSEYPMKAL
jgi:hypothetical protein